MTARIVVECDGLPATPPIDGKEAFRLSYRDGDGETTCVRTGQSYAEAQRAAAKWAVEGMPVLDRTGGRIG
jgi:hypothetical protein